ncbi:MAG: type II secretion system minor pseudopilin GspK [Nitrospinota bacterium]|nr:type II secretion system minor pseudopilin GspK [Nitrospinota bacterium]MDH5678957.1 type II secretion system minor pseudopilin GspK [Nitrospinota bacterium]MDH5755478.1 type II secretion system minor pseudopilin GspK [Nitrospinota bacterium]
MRLRPAASREGMALILVVTVVALLSILVVDFMGKAWVESAMATSYRDETQAYYAARSGQEAAKLLLKAQASGQSLAGMTPEMAAAGIPLPLGDDYAFFSIIDESGKIDLNQLITNRGYPNDRWIEVLKRLLARLEQDPNMAWAVVDWMDPDSEPRYGGAETPYYSSRTPPYRAKNAPFDSVDELALVKGFKPEVMAKIREHVTVWSSGKLNINTATPMAIMALDDSITEGMVKELIKIRMEKPFATINEISKAPGFSEVFPRIALMITVKSDTYSVRSSATFNETSKSIVGVYKAAGMTTKTLYYKTL